MADRFITATGKPGVHLSDPNPMDDLGEDGAWVKAGVAVPVQQMVDNTPTMDVEDNTMLLLSGQEAIPKSYSEMHALYKKLRGRVGGRSLAGDPWTLVFVAMLGDCLERIKILENIHTQIDN